jgi:hypothetical protein
MLRFITAGLLAALLLTAQTPEATVNGVVTDGQGGIVPGAEVTMLNLATSVRSGAQTGADGRYIIRALPIGRYQLAVEKSGFKRYVRDGLVLTTAQKLELDVRLDLGQVTESVNVNAGASLLETQTSESAQLIESKSVEDIPLGDRRTMNIVALTGAAVFVNYDSGGKPNFSLAGGRTQSQNFYLDGGTIQNMRLGIGQIDTDPPVETVAEVKVIANGYSAEYGGSAGGVVVASTKSGTNRIRGSAYEYLRNEKLDAGNFFSPVNARGEKIRAPLRYNVYGLTVGGPVTLPKLYNGRDKTFFFFSWEGSRRSEGLVQNANVPLDAWRTGNLTGQAAIYDPLTTRGMLRDPFPGNQIPASRIDPVARNILAFYPQPNLPGVANNYVSNYQQRLTRDAFLVKGDHNFSAKDRISLRYLYNSDDLDFSTILPRAAAETRGPALRHQNFFYGTWNHTFSPTVLNEFRFTYGNRINHELYFEPGQRWPQALGIRGIDGDPFPQINVTGILGLGKGGQERRQFPIQQFHYVNNLSIVRGRHTTKLGLEYRPSYNFEQNLPLVSGSFGFVPQATGLPGVASSGLGFASLLVGAPTAFSTRRTEDLDRRSYYWAWFLQDDWNIHRDLTLNLGVRWETDTPIVDLNNRMNGFDPLRRNPVSGTLGVVRFMGQDGFRSNPYSTDRNNFGPRIGLAWKPFGSKRTVLRAGWGAFFAHPFDAGAPNSASLGYELSAAINSPDNGVTIPFYLRDGITGLTLTAPARDDSFGAVALGRNPNTAVTYYEENRRTGYSMQHNFSVQHEVSSGLLLQAQYLGNMSRKLASPNLSLNQVRPELLTATSTQRDRPFQQFTNVSILLPTLGVSNYHALALKAERRFSSGFNFLGTYTFSKFLNNTNEGGAVLGAEGGVYSDFYNRRADYGPSENDVTHRVTFSSVYELPFGKGKRWLDSGVVSKLVGGWSASGVATMQSGPPFTVTTQVNSVFSAAGALRADVARNPNLAADQRTLGRWFDTGAFSQPVAGRFGNQGVGLLRADGLVNIDFSLLRTFALPGEDRKLQFRAESFNFANHPDFGVPGRVFGAPGFGQVNSARRGRSIQLGLRLVF